MRISRFLTYADVMINEDRCMLIIGQYVRWMVGKMISGCLKSRMFCVVWTEKYADRTFFPFQLRTCETFSKKTDKKSDHEKIR